MNEITSRVAIAIGEKIKPALEGGRPVALGEVALAAIKAMRGATEAMRDAGVNAVVEERIRHRAAQQSGHGWSYSEVDITWAAMIDAALKEP